MDTYPVKISLEEAVELMLVHSKETDTKNIPLCEAWHRIAAENLLAAESIPPFDKSAYDGYALQSADIKEASYENPVTLNIIEEIPAGKHPQFEIVPGSAAKILTGAPLPVGADVVIPYEKTVFDEKTVRITTPLNSGQNIVKKGEDISCGDISVSRGSLIEASDMAQLAGVGCTGVCVYEKLRAGIICTGSELAKAGEPLSPGKIRNSNSFMVSGYLYGIGAEPEDFGICPDVAAVIADRLKEAVSRCDCVITTGGASVGDYDVMKEAIVMAGGEILFWKIRMRPGMAVIGGRIGGKPVFALSGNPGTAAVTMQLLVLPVLRKMMGMENFYPKKIQVKMLGDYKKGSPYRRLLRGRMIIKNGEAYFLPSSKQKNSMTSASRDCLVLGEIPAGNEGVLEGTMIFAYDLEHF